MKIVVCIKQVPDTKGGVKFNPDGTLDRGAMLAIMNPDDKAGLEAALRLKDQYGAEHRRIDAFELWCWRRLLRVPWTARRSKQSILRRSVLGFHCKD